MLLPFLLEAIYNFSYKEVLKEMEKEVERD
jgi:hypothetical protein